MPDENYSIIGIAGYANSGKDTVAEYISEFTFGQYKQFNLADPVKEAASKMFGIPLENFYNEKKEEIDSYWGFSPRYITQKLGTEGGRELFQKDIWLHRMMLEYENAISEGYRGLVIPDIRFPNEISFMKEHFSKTYFIRIKRDNISPVFPHESESYINTLDVDRDLDNNFTLKNLRAKVYTLINEQGVAHNSL